MMPASLGVSRPDLAAGIAHDVGLGWHCTGSPGDLATSDWIAARRAPAGYRVDRVPIGVETLTTADATLMIDGAPSACALHWAPGAIDGEVAGPRGRRGRRGTEVARGLARRRGARRIRALTARAVRGAVRSHASAAADPEGL